MMNLKLLNTMKNLTGNIYGKWIVLSEGLRAASNKRQWLCKCICGKEVLVHQGNLSSGRSTGCMNCRPTAIKHGLAKKHRLYLTWKTMRSRCNNPNNKSYIRYGGRGISVCKEWDDFTIFLADMESSFEEGKTLDRIDNNGNYCKSNCKWSTNIEQANNKRNNLKLIYNGHILSEAELARLTGISRTTIQVRRNKGASVEEMIHGFNRI